LPQGAKGNPKNTPHSTASTVGRVISYLSPRLGVPPDIPIGNTDFQAVLSDLSSADDSIATAVKFAGKVRNTVGHNLGWKAALEKSQYDSLAKMIASSCLHSVACLYPSPRLTEHSTIDSNQLACPDLAYYLY
jgi:hypothetical protein